MINWKDKTPGNFTFAHFGLVFLFLAASLVSLITVYWIVFLEPQINDYSKTQSTLIAQSQSWILANAIDNLDDNPDLLIERMDEILILSDANTEIPYIHGIAIELEDAQNTRLISRGNVNCNKCFAINIPLYASTNYELVGQATFYSNNDLFNFLRSNIRNKIVVSSFMVMMFIAVAWFVIWKLINQERVKDQNISTMFDSIPFPMIVTDPMLNRTVYSNRAANLVFGGRLGKPYKGRPRELFPDSDVAPCLGQTKELLSFESEIRAHTNAQSWAMVTISPVTYNNEQACLVAFADITATKKAKDEIDESKRRFATIVNSLEDFVYVIRDEQKQILFANTSEDYIKEFELNCAYNCVSRTNSEHAQTSDIVSCDYYIEKHNCWYTSRHRIITWIDGKAVRLVTITDISKLIRIQLELEKEKEKAEVASRAKSEFLATMSHEIRTPMNGILGMLNLMKYTPLTEEQKSYLNTVDISSEQLLLLLNDILDISKIESGKLVLENNSFKMSRLACDCMHLIENRSIEKHLDLYLNVHPALPDNLIGDETRLRQILINLLGNAVKFTESGSISLKIDVVRQHQDWVDLSFSVSDTGIGIPEEKQRLLFEKFSQIDSGASRKYGGSGLGLAISKKLINAMGGEISFRNNSDRGATFYFTLSLQIDHEAVEQELMSEGSHVDIISSGLSILLAEDNKINSYAAKSLLEKDGHTVVVAENGREAVNAVTNSEFCFDVVLMDIHMPEVDGIEACRQIRALNDKQKQSVPIVALTANIMQDEKQKCLEAGMDAFITKPFTTERLKQELVSVIKISKTQE